MLTNNIAKAVCFVLMSFVSQWVISDVTVRDSNPKGHLFSDGLSVPASLKSADGRWMLVEGVIQKPSVPNKEAPIIGVVDSGVLKEHPQLHGLIIDSYDYTGEGIEDRLGHGTVVAILTQQGADSFPLLVAKVANADGSIRKNDLMLAIDWIVNKGASVVNLSLGFREDEGDFSDLCDLIGQYKKSLFVAAAGNFGPDVRVFPAACDLPNLLCVGALDENGIPASYSGRCQLYAPGTVKLKPKN